MLAIGRMPVSRSAVMLLVLALLAAPLAVGAQPAGKMYPVALVLTTSPVSEMWAPTPSTPWSERLSASCAHSEYVEGQNLVLERRSAGGRFERSKEILEELVALKMDIIVTAGDDMTRRAKEVTTCLSS
jgi:hypothetical protein